MSGISKFSGIFKDELIEMIIKRGNISKNTRKRGYAPAGSDKLCCESLDGEESSLSSDDSGSSSSPSVRAGAVDSVETHG
jgi:hypothetical protein